MNKLFFRCKKCLFPSTKPDLQFDDKGICMACKFTEHYNSIDWDKREKQFYKLIDKYKNRRKGTYDCTIPVSGGKDSTYQTYLITKKAGLKPLLLSFEPSFPTEIGKANLKNLVDTFGCDLMELKKSPTYRKLARIGFDVVGDHEWPNHVGIHCWPVRVAYKFNIPLTFYGEPRGTIGLGTWASLIDKGGDEWDRSDIEQYVGMNGYRLNDIMEYDKSIKSEDVIPYIYPSEEELKFDIKSYTLGHFFKWEFQENIKIIKNFGWKSDTKNTEGTFTNFEDLDCGFMPIHHYFKFIKYGYGRSTDHACYEIRQGRMTKKQAKELIIEYDGKIPTKYSKEFLEFLKITEEYFLKKRDHFANPILFKKDVSKKFIYGNDNNLLVNKLWYDSFDI